MTPPQSEPSSASTRKAADKLGATEPAPGDSFSLPKAINRSQAGKILAALDR